MLSKKKKLNSRVFRALGEEFEVCPFELQFEAARDADTVICDYNYVFSPRSALSKLSTVSDQGKPNLVIDEAHNLPSRAMDYILPRFQARHLIGFAGVLRVFHRDSPSEVESLIDGCIQVISGCRPPERRPFCRDGDTTLYKAVASGTRGSRIEPPVASFLAQDADLRTFLSRYLDADSEIQPRDPVLRLCFYWAEFTDALQYVTDGSRSEFFTTYMPNSDGGTVKITCCDAAEMLKECYENYESVVAFSATSGPLNIMLRFLAWIPRP